MAPSRVTIHTILSALFCCATVAIPVHAQAQTQSYAYAYDNIFGLVISGSGAIQVVSSVDMSQSQAALGSAHSSAGGAGVIDPAQSGLGHVVSGENSFAAQGPGGPSYSRADAQIISRQFPGPGAIQIAGVAESYLAGAGNAAATAMNGSVTGISFSFSVESPNAVLAFDFLANPFLQVRSGLDFGAIASMSTTFKVTNSDGLTVFEWTPDGQLGSGIFGGTETADSFSLNTELASTQGGAAAIYNPAACAVPDGSVSTSCGGLFGAVTGPLALGQYLITLESSSSSAISAVPEPSTWLSLLSGLALIGWCRRGRRHAR